MSQATAFATPPFDNPAADTIIRSRDGINFRVRSGIIAEASPIFSDMFSIPQPAIPPADSPDYMDGSPVVAVEEDSLTLDRLLRLCYPTADPQLPELRDVRLVLAAALKYEMDESISLMKRALLGYVEEVPLAVWASACILRLEDEARIAATAMLGKDLPEDAPPELHEITAGTYFRLMKFHRMNGNVSVQFRFCEPDASDVPQPKRTYKRPETHINYQQRPFADIVCRSSDGEEFQTHKIILCSASSMLSGRILSLPPADPSSSTALPVLELDVRGAPLGSVLELCYPIECTAPLGELPVHHALAMLDCARKLQMKALLSRLRYNAVGSLKVSYPLAIYVLASSLGLSEIAEDALAFLHADPFTYGCIPEMETTPAYAYHHLHINRRESLAVASKMTSAIDLRVASAAATNTVVPNEPDAMDMDDTGTTENASSASPEGSTSSGHPWLLGILKRTVEDLRSPHQDEQWWQKPNTSATLEEAVERHLWCASCEENVQLILRIEKLHAEVRKAMGANNEKLLKRR